MTPDERMQNPAGVIQGGFLSAFADSAMGAAAVTYVQDRKVVVANAEMKISFLAGVKAGDKLTCVAEVISAGSRVAFLEATITNDSERIVSRVSSTYLYRDRN